MMVTDTIMNKNTPINSKSFVEWVALTMKLVLNGTNYRRTKQINFKTQNNQVPQALNKKFEISFTKNPLTDYELGYFTSIAVEIITKYLSKPEIEKRIREKRKAMQKATKELDFMQAAQLRDALKALQAQRP